MEQINKNIEDLLEKFFEGATTNFEESQLYDFFSEENVPESLKKYKMIFQYFESGLEVELNSKVISEKDDVTVGTYTAMNTNNTLLNKKWILAVSAVAASLILMLITIPYHNEDDFNPYEGSYVRYNGIVTSDVDAIEAEQARIESMIAEKIACMNEVIAAVKDQVDEAELQERRLKLKFENIIIN